MPSTEQARHLGPVCGNRISMIRITIMAALITLALPSAAAASCSTYAQARAAHPSSYLVYRLEGRKAGGRQCWYAAGSAKSSRGGVEGHAYEQKAAAYKRPMMPVGTTAERGGNEYRHRAGVEPGPRETIPSPRAKPIIAFADRWVDLPTEAIPYEVLITPSVVPVRTIPFRLSDGRFVEVDR